MQTVSNDQVRFPTSAYFTNLVYIDSGVIYGNTSTSTYTYNLPSDLTYHSAGSAKLLLGGALRVQGGGDANGIKISGSLTIDNPGVTFRGIYYAPTIASIASGAYHRAIETTSGDIVFNGGDLYISGSLYGSRTQTVNSGSTTIYSMVTSSYNSSFFDYHIISGSNGRAGTVTGFWLSGSIINMDNTTGDIGNTSGFSWLMSITGSNTILQASASSANWTVKTTFRTL